MVLGSLKHILRKLSINSRRAEKQKQQQGQGGGNIKSNAARLVQSMLSARGIQAAALVGGGGFALSAASFGGGSIRRSGRRGPQDFGHEMRRVTDVLLVLNALTFALDYFLKDALINFGCKLNALITQGQYWRLLTPTFLHASIPHLLINCYSLHMLGPSVEASSGRARFILVYLFSGFVGCLFSYQLCTSPSVGASGAIFGLTGALLVFYYRHKDILGDYSMRSMQGIMVNVLLNVALGATSNRIDNWGHIGGFVGGLVASFLLGPHLVKRRRRGKQILIDDPPIKLFKSV